MTKITNLILIGGGRSCTEIIDLINDINNFKTDKIKIIGIIDDDVKLKNRKITSSVFVVVLFFPHFSLSCCSTRSCCCAQKCQQPPAMEWAAYRISKNNGDFI